MLYLALFLSSTALFSSPLGSAAGFVSLGSRSDIPGARKTNSVVLLRTDVPKRVPSTMQTIRGYMQVRSRKCIVIESHASEMLIIWPSDTRLKIVDDHFSVSAGKWANINVGDEITLGGSGSQPVHVNSISGVFVPEECRKYQTFIVGEGGVLDKSGR